MILASLILYYLEHVCGAAEKKDHLTELKFSA